MASTQSETKEPPKENYLNSFMSFVMNDENEGENSTGGDSTQETLTSEKINDEKMKDSNKQIDEESNNSKYSNDTENDSFSSVPRRNVAKRGRKRKHSDFSDTILRETPRRAASRSVKCYVDDDAYNDIDVPVPDDPDYQFSDSDDDPDFDPAHKKAGIGSPEIDGRYMKKKGRGKRRGRPSIKPRNSSSELSRNNFPSQEEIQEISSSSPNTKLGKPSTYFPATVTTPVQVSDNTVSSTDDSRSKLSSAFNYVAARSRQNPAIRLPEGPNLSDEQLKLIESQFKSGDFVMSKKDTDMMEHPPIWRIDGKSLLQKFQAFDKDGKTLYRNISTYSGWTAQAKALYIPVKVNFVFQSRYDTVVELLDFNNDGKEVQESKPLAKFDWGIKNKETEITDEMKTHMASFEIYLQTLISQALDNNFLQEIYEENDTYFVEKVKAIDDLTEERKAKVLQLVQWNTKFLTSLDTWPCVNTMVAKISGNCQACEAEAATMLSQFYGQPYDKKTLRSREPSLTDLENKNFETCDKCSTLSQLFNKVTHQKYDFYSQCKSTVTNMRVSWPSKTTTTVLRDLLANDEWINGLFRAMCTSWIKIDIFHKENLPNSESAVADSSIDSSKDKETDQSEPHEVAAPIGSEELPAKEKEPKETKSDIESESKPNSASTDTKQNSDSNSSQNKNSANSSANDKPQDVESIT